MRTSPQRHTLAVLRLTLGMGQKQMAELVGRSTRTIQAIELGQLPLSEELAQEIARQTGVSLQWLLNGEVAKPPLDNLGTRYTKQRFEEVQSGWQRKSADEPDRHAFRIILWQTIATYAGIAASAAQRGKFKLFDYKLAKALGSLAEEFGEREDLFRPEFKSSGMESGKAAKLFEAESARALNRLCEVIDKEPAFDGAYKRVLRFAEPGRGKGKRVQKR